LSGGVQLLFESVGFLLFSVEANVEAFNVALEVFDFFLKITDLGLFGFQHLLRASEIATCVLDAVVKKLDLFFVLLRLTIFVLDDLLESLLVFDKFSDLVLAVLKSSFKVLPISLKFFRVLNLWLLLDNNNFLVLLADVDCELQ
jgi:hypothetical protein